MIHEVRHSGKSLEVAALDLSGTLEDILDRVNELADRIRRLRDEALGPESRCLIELASHVRPTPPAA